MARTRSNLSWLAGLAALTAAGPALAGDCNAPCKVPCPTPFFWYAEGPPKLRFKKACPRPVCDPCSYDHAGYYQTCWQPWAYPPDWSHCPVPPPAALLAPPSVPPYAPRVPAIYTPPERPPEKAPPARNTDRPAEKKPPVDPEDLPRPRSSGTSLEVPPVQTAPTSQPLSSNARPVEVGSTPNPTVLRITTRPDSAPAVEASTQPSRGIRLISHRE